ncbi:hypothetical protein ACFSWE_08625 [Leucobacter albus]|uniref:Uncharacterized protein n=1 Tax=Leucobacter albus TaxID=272210 RepID=A0ABW3TQU4_9MICO
MAHVEVVNRQEIDGVNYERGEVIEVSAGRARDLISAGKVRAAEKPKRVPASNGGSEAKESPKPAPATKEVAKNG